MLTYAIASLLFGAFLGLNAVSVAVVFLGSFFLGPVVLALVSVIGNTESATVGNLILTLVLFQAGYMVSLVFQAAPTRLNKTLASFWPHALR